jgi:hypothetical protein
VSRVTRVKTIGLSLGYEHPIERDLVDWREPSRDEVVLGGDWRRRKPLSEGGSAPARGPAESLNPGAFPLRGSWSMPGSASGWVNRNGAGLGDHLGGFLEVGCVLWLLPGLGRVREPLPADRKGARPPLGPLNES